MQPRSCRRAPTFHHMWGAWLPLSATKWGCTASMSWGEEAQAGVGRGGVGRGGVVSGRQGRRGRALRDEGRRPLAASGCEVSRRTAGRQVPRRALPRPDPHLHRPAVVLFFAAGQRHTVQRKRPLAAQGRSMGPWAAVGAGRAGAGRAAPSSRQTRRGLGRHGSRAGRQRSRAQGAARCNPAAARQKIDAMQVPPCRRAPSHVT